jgi:hypothetical protein
MNPFTLIEKWISEHGSAATLRDHVALFKSQMDALKSEVADLKATLKDIEAERDGLKKQLDRFSIGQPADICPFCRRATGQLIDIKPASNLTRTRAGVEAHFFKCSNPDCGKNYDKPAKPA